MLSQIANGQYTRVTEYDPTWEGPTAVPGALGTNGLLVEPTYVVAGAS
ncbi:MAG: hypothetical protein M0Z87_11965 [Actinomycetota bacterium]|nr:hypothetical protein [Actinomycetota bacterium]